MPNWLFIAVLVASSWTALSVPSGLLLGRALARRSQ